jgi:hypothetical protein
MRQADGRHPVARDEGDAVSVRQRGGNDEIGSCGLARSFDGEAAGGEEPAGDGEGAFGQGRFGGQPHRRWQGRLALSTGREDEGGKQGQPSGSG